MFRKKYWKTKFIPLFIIAIVVYGLDFNVYAGWSETNIGRMYIDENGEIIKGWRWLDLNNDGIMECYRFNQDGYLIASGSDTRNHKTNENGQWIDENGLVIQKFKSSGKLLYQTKVEAPGATYEGNGTNRIDASGRNTYTILAETTKSKEELQKEKEKETEVSPENVETKKAPTIKTAKNKKKVTGTKGGDPRSVFTPSEAYLLGKNVKLKVEDDTYHAIGPVAVATTNQVINTAKEEETRYLEEGERIVAGRDLRLAVTSSNKYTRIVDNVKVYGGDVWDDCILLNGNGAYIKLNGSMFNYFTFEIAHQTHGTSTADTTASLELYIKGEFITSYDDFNDDKPEFVEEWFDEGDTQIELKLVVEGAAPGRKVYLRNAKMRKIREKKDD